MAYVKFDPWAFLKNEKKEGAEQETFAGLATFAGVPAKNEKSLGEGTITTIGFNISPEINNPDLRNQIKNKEPPLRKSRKLRKFRMRFLSLRLSTHLSADARITSILPVGNSVSLTRNASLPIGHRKPKPLAGPAQSYSGCTHHRHNRIRAITGYRDTTAPA